MICLYQEFCSFGILNWDSITYKMTIGFLLSFYKMTRKCELQDCRLEDCRLVLGKGKTFFLSLIWQEKWTKLWSSPRETTKALKTLQAASIAILNENLLQDKARVENFNFRLLVLFFFFFLLNPSSWLS